MYFHSFNITGAPEMGFGGYKYGGGKYFKSKQPIEISVRRSICWYNFYANRFSGLEVVTHTYIHTEFGQCGSSIRVTLNTKPASQVLISARLGGAGVQVALDML